MPTIYLDECGYTGEDLLNKEQPIFVLASLACDEQTAKEIKNEYFGNFQGDTLKHSILKKKKRNQEAVKNFISSIRSHSKIKTIIRFAVKRFVASGKMVDLLIEPTVREEGIDLYERGANIATSNMIYSVAPLAIGESRFQHILDFFVKAVRTRQKHFYNSMMDEINKAISTSQHREMAEQCLSFYQIAHSKQGYENLIHDLPDNILDLSLDFAVDISCEWREFFKNGEIINIIHDKSSNMAERELIWKTLVSADMPPALVGYDRRTRQFPIGINNVSFEADQNSLGLQLTDILAGAISTGIQWALGTRSPDDAYGKMLGEMIPQHAIDLGLDGIFPTRDVTPEELDTEGPVYDDPLLYTGLALRNAGINMRKKQYSP